MAYSQTDLDAINSAIASGALSVAFRDRTVTYRSIDDLLKAKRTIEAEIAGTASTPRMYPRRQVATFDD